MGRNYIVWKKLSDTKYLLTYLYPDLAVTKRRQPPLCRGVVTGQKVKNKNLIHTLTLTQYHHTHPVSPHSPSLTTLTQSHHTHPVSPHSPSLPTLPQSHPTYPVSPHSPSLTTLTQSHCT